MFGYIIPRIESLDRTEQERYQSVYCGLCRSLGRCSGQCSRFTLSYDMTFLALVLSSMYEKQEASGQGRCLIHPAKPRAFVQSDCIEYAADMSVVLAYHKCLDDWKDDSRVRSWAAAGVLSRPYETVKKLYPHTCEVVEYSMQEIARIEKKALCQAGTTHRLNACIDENPDEAANCFGMLLGEIFAWQNDFWSEDLRRFGARLGKFVYVMDAVMDFDEDKQSGSYNPLIALQVDPAHMKEDLEMLALSAVDAFERLPLVQDVHLLRSVLYAGMWQKYLVKNEETNGN